MKHKQFCLIGLFLWWHVILESRDSNLWWSSLWLDRSLPFFLQWKAHFFIKRILQVLEFDSLLSFDGFVLVFFGVVSRFETFKPDNNERYYNISVVFFNFNSFLEICVLCVHIIHSFYYLTVAIIDALWMLNMASHLDLDCNFDKPEIAH